MPKTQTPAPLNDGSYWKRIKACAHPDKDGGEHFEQKRHEVGAEAQELQEQIRRLTDEMILKQNESYEYSMDARDIRMNRRLREQRRLSVQAQYEALVKGEPMPEAAVRRDEKGRLLPGANDSVEFAPGNTGGTAG